MKAIAVVFVILLLLPLAITAKTTYALNPYETLTENLSVFGIDGYAANISITINPPVFSENDTLLTLTLTVKEPFSARGTTINPSDYYVNRKTLDAYLIGGVLIDYDRARIVNTLWTNWANTQNDTYLQEEHAIYANMYWINFSRIFDGSYRGIVTLPVISSGSHNATVWVRAEQDQVTTYSPLWSAFTQTIDLTCETPSSTPIPEISSLALILLVIAGGFGVLLCKKRTRKLA